MGRYLSSSISLVIILVCLAFNSLFGLGKSNTVLVGMIDWKEITYPDFGIRFFLPKDMNTTELENGPFSALVGTTDDGVTMVIQGSPQSVTLDGLEEWVLEDLEIDGESFELIDEEESFHNLTYRLYMDVGNDVSYWIMVARNLKQDYSYVVYVQTPTKLAETYQTAFFFWFTNIYGF